jgi:hypothetical protein
MRGLEMGVLRLTEEQWAFVERFIPQQHMGQSRTRDKEYSTC